VLREHVPRGVAAAQRRLLREPLDQAVGLHLLHVGEVGGEPALLAEVGGAALLEGPDVGLPERRARATFGVDREEPISDPVVRLGQRREPRDRDAGGRELVQRAHAAREARVERVHQGHAEPRGALAGDVGLDLVGGDAPGGLGELGRVRLRRHTPCPSRCSRQ
jgi:hypothetical protein